MCVTRETSSDRRPAHHDARGLLTISRTVLILPAGSSAVNNTNNGAAAGNDNSKNSNNNKTTTKTKGVER